MSKLANPCFYVGVIATVALHGIFGDCSLTSSC